MKAETIIFGIAFLLAAFGIWEYLAIRRMLDVSAGGRLREVALSWRLLGILMGFMLLATALFLAASVQRQFVLPPSFIVAVVTLAALFVAIIMMLFRSTLAKALETGPAIAQSAEEDADTWRDALTGLPNRRALEFALKQEWHRSERHKRPLSILVIDLDDFAKFTEEAGRDGADAYLKAIAPFILGQLRVGDTIARHDLDTFTIILPEEGPASARLVAERLRKNIAEFRVEINKRKLSVTASIGVASNVIGEMESYSELIERAEHALDAAKSAGRNRVVAVTGSGKRAVE